MRRQAIEPGEILRIQQALETARLLAGHRFKDQPCANESLCGSIEGVYNPRNL